MSARSGWPGSAPEDPVPRPGDTVRDTGNDRIGRMMGFVGPYVQLRPIGGGVEWDACPELLRPVTASESLSADVARVNARSRGERL